MPSGGRHAAKGQVEAPVDMQRRSKKAVTGQQAVDAVIELSGWTAENDDVTALKDDASRRPATLWAPDAKARWRAKGDGEDWRCLVFFVGVAMHPHL